MVLFICKDLTMTERKLKKGLMWSCSIQIAFGGCTESWLAIRLLPQLVQSRIRPLWRTAPSQMEVTNFNYSNHLTTSKGMAVWRALVDLQLTQIQDPTLWYTIVWFQYWGRVRQPKFQWYISSLHDLFLSVVLIESWPSPTVFLLSFLRLAYSVLGVAIWS